MKIIADENIEQLQAYFGDIAQVTPLAGRQISHSDLQDADALLVRSVTNVNAELLQNTPIKFVGSATIGVDHVDLSYLALNQIAFANAAGCNAQAVAEYILTTILTLDDDCARFGVDFTVGIVGLGNVGTAVAALCQKMGWTVLGYDPLVTHPLVKQVSLEQLVQSCDVLTLHVPITFDTPYPTFNLINKDIFNLMPAETILINAARGKVINETDLMQDIAESGRIVVLDVFADEPEPTETLLDHLVFATPHVAGYSLEGKLRGTQMIYDAFCHHFNLPNNKNMQQFLPAAAPIFGKQNKFFVDVAQNCTTAYNIAKDDDALRAQIKNGKVHASDFDALRKNYPLRREWAYLGLKV